MAEKRSLAEKGGNSNPIGLQPIPHFEVRCIRPLPLSKAPWGGVDQPRPRRGRVLARMAGQTKARAGGRNSAQAAFEKKKGEPHDGSTLTVPPNNAAPSFVAGAEPQRGPGCCMG